MQNNNLDKNNLSSGHIHPISQMIREIYDIFQNIGYEIVFGPELETEFYNFDALNVPADHPSRDMQDTFWIKQNPEEKEKKLLRTQTSAVQIHHMENNEPPFKIIVPGRVFRNEATDATHEANFFQLEGLCVDKDVTMKDLKGLLEYFFEKFFGEDIKVRFRPSYFPFVEPGVEVDVFTKGKWMEVMGAGMVHPKVLTSVGVDSNEYRGFAFGIGLDRFAMIKYGIPDVRMLYQPDLRIFNQF